MVSKLPVWCDDVDADSVQKALLQDEEATRLSEVFKVLSDPNRLRLLSLLLSQEVCVQILAEALGMSQSAVSHQLRMLRKLGLVRHRKDGRRVFYTLDDDHVRALFTQSLAHIAHS